MTDTRFVTARDGARLTVESGGAGPPLLLIHGTGARRSLWTPVRQLLETRFTVHAPDRRGHGDSDDRSGYAIEREYEDILCCVEALGPEPVSVVAHSYGALCALGAARPGANIGRLVLYEPPLPMTPYAYFSETLTPAMREALDRGDRDGAASLFLEGVLDIRPETIAIMRRVSAWNEHRALAPLAFRELLAVEALQGRLLTYASWTIPALLLLGEKSPPRYHDTARGLNAALPGSVVETLPGQKHGAIAAAPALFAAAVTRFLSPA